MARAACADLLVSRIRELASRIARFGSDYTGQFFEVGFHTPETAAREYRGLGLRRLGFRGGNLLCHCIGCERQHDQPENQPNESFHMIQSLHVKAARPVAPGADRSAYTARGPEWMRESAERRR